MICPFCKIAFHDDSRDQSPIGHDAEGDHVVESVLCPQCDRLTLIHKVGTTLYFEGSGTSSTGFGKISRQNIFNPPGGSRRPAVPQVVPASLAKDYEEAAAVLGVSSQASAAISRRCLQNTIREKTGITRGTLEREIDEVIDTHQLPTELAEQLDAVRQIGNFAAHPIKSQETGAVMDVEPGEAEWNLDVLDGLFDYWYVRPAMLQARKDALNEKLREAGKQELP